MPALLLTNPRAGLGRQRFAFKDAADHARVVLGEQQLPAPRGHELIIVEGGDGTLQRVMTDLLAKTEAKALPPIAVLPGGRTNMSAADINEHRRFRRCASRLQAILQGASAAPLQIRSLVEVRHREPMPMDAKAHDERSTAAEGTLPSKPHTNHKPASVATGATAGHARTSAKPLEGADGKRRYGWFFGLGAVCAGIRHWGDRRPSSHLGLDLRTAWAVLREFRNPSLQQEVSCNGQARQVLAMMATTLNRLLFHSRPYWNVPPATQAGATMHSTWVFAEAQKVLRRSLRLLRGDAALAALPGYQSGEVTSLHLDFDGLYALDGELFQHNGPLSLSLSDPIRWQPL